jgi:DNA-nicking Smr family endonuclease
MNKNKKTKNRRFVEFDSIKIDNKLKPAEEYETPLQTLERLFQTLSLDIIESIYEDNDRNYYITKSALEVITNNEPESDNNNIAKEENDKVEDINQYVKFRFDDIFIDEPNSEIVKNKKTTKKNKLWINPDSINAILSQQKKNADSYDTVLTTSANISTPVNKKEEHMYLEEMCIEYYIDIINEFFPKMNRTEIMEKICEFDLDIDKLILNLLDSHEYITNEEFTKLESDQISNIDELLSNFYLKNEHELETIKKQQTLQVQIEKEIKKNTMIEKMGGNVLLNENDFPFLSEDIKEDVLNSHKASDEYFLDKDIKDIKNRKIREDLMKLIKNFPFVDEYEIKWVYFNFLDYHLTYKHINSTTQKNTKKEIFEKEFIPEKKLDKVEEKSDKTEIRQSQTDSNVVSMITKIISENPNNWKMGDVNNVNIEQYQQIRRKLMSQAQVAWRLGRHKDAQVIMAKARRYKQEINKLVESNKINVFLRNNLDKNIINLINNRENFIDVHGLSYDEAEIIISKKIKDIRRCQDNGEISKFTLYIITGVGNHSKNKTPVLLPRLSSYIKQKKFKFKVDDINGIIKIIL